MATAGLQYQYPFVAHTAAGAFVLEPIAQLIFRPETVEQKGIPNEDAKSLVFNDAILFGVDKFSGFDRIETGSRLNAGVQSTFQANAGGYARLLLGQSFQLSSSTPFAVGTGLEDKQSDYVAGLYLEPNRFFRFIGQARFDNDTFETNRIDAASLITWGPIALSATYAYQRDLLTVDTVGNHIVTSPHEIMTGGQIKLADYWYLVGGIRYDIANDRRLQDAIGIKYLDDCFMLTGIYTETLYEDPTVAKDRTFMVRFELKNLGGFGPKTTSSALIPAATNLPFSALNTTTAN
jgi:LPS-assembly protein